MNYTKFCNYLIDDHQKWEICRLRGFVSTKGIKILITASWFLFFTFNLTKIKKCI